MTRKQRLKELMNQKQSFERDQEIKKIQNEFISKSQVNRRLFDNVFEKVSKKKKYHGLNRRENGVKK